MPAQQISISVWHGRSAKLEEPVLVDPLSGTVYDVARTEFEGHFRVPLVDYPLILTDAAALTGMVAQP